VTVAAAALWALSAFGGGLLIGSILFGWLDLRDLHERGYQEGYARGQQEEAIALAAHVRQGLRKTSFTSRP
jgi:hypothetical protein